MRISKVTFTWLDHLKWDETKQSVSTRRITNAPHGPHQSITNSPQSTLACLGSSALAQASNRSRRYLGNARRVRGAAADILVP